MVTLDPPGTVKFILLRMATWVTVTTNLMSSFVVTTAGGRVVVAVGTVVVVVGGTVVGVEGGVGFD